MWINLKFLYMWSNFKCSTWQMWRNILHYQKIMCAIYGVLLQNMFFAIYAVLSRNRFVAIYALLRGENLGQKLCPWRKNYKYEVWAETPQYHQTSQMQGCSLKVYRDESLLRKTQCKKAVGYCKTAAVRFISHFCGANTDKPAICLRWTQPSSWMSATWSAWQPKPQGP